MSGLRLSVGRLCVAFAGASGVLLCWLAFAGVARAALPDGRAYELVSQAETNGAPAFDEVGGVAQFINDDTFWFGDAATPVESSPSGAEAVYSASRGEHGWSDTSLSMADLGHYQEERFVDATREDVGGDGTPVASIWRTDNPLIFTQVPPSYATEGLYYRGSEGNYSLIVAEPSDGEGGSIGGIEYGGMSASGQTVVYQAVGGPGSVSGVYAWHPNGVVETLSTGALGECGAHTVLGNGDSDSEAQATNSVSEDGSTVFMESSQGALAPCPSEPQVYVNEKGVVSLISTPSNGAPLSPEAKAAWFVGATPDGRTAYFISRGNLTSENPEEEGDELYQWKAGQGISCVTCKAGALLETNASGDAAVSSNGQDVWIVTNERAVDPDTLYLYAHGQLQAAPELKAPSEVPIKRGAFSISPSGEEVAIALHQSNGTQTGTDVLYRVSDATGSLEESCLSCADGVPHEGTLGIAESEPLDGVPSAATVGGQLEGALTDNGETIVFTSPAALTPGAQPGSTGLQDVYEWNQERGVSLIAEDDTYGATISPDGSNIFFTSFKDLAPTATQSSSMLYDARVGGGFPEGSAPTKSACAAESTCQGSSGAVALPAVGPMPSAGNLAGVHTEKARLGRIVLSHPELASLELDGTTTVRLQSKGAGTVTLSAKCMLVGRSVGCARASASSVAGGGTLSLRLRLSRAARDAFASSGRLRLSLTATLAGASARHASFMLVKQAPGHRKRPAAKPSVKHGVDASEVQQ